MTVRFVEEPAISRAQALADTLFKCTVADFGWLIEKRVPLQRSLRERRGGSVAGICGGCQMLGEQNQDSHRVESDETSARGLGLLPVPTRFAKTKCTAQARASASQAFEFVTAMDLAEYFRLRNSHGERRMRTRGAVSHFVRCSRR